VANAGGLLVVLLGGLIGLGLVVATIALVVYGIVAEDPRRGFRASVAALTLSMLAALISTPFWIVVLSGRDTHGEKLDFGESWPIVALVVVEAVGIVAAAVGVVRQRAARRRLER
jgi:hypothetical protein